MLGQAVQLIGAALILLAFVGVQVGQVDQRSRGYLLVNALGSAALAADAVHGRQWGFLVLEGAWAVVSAAGLATYRAPSPAVQRTDIATSA